MGAPNIVQGLLPEEPLKISNGDMLMMTQVVPRFIVRRSKFKLRSLFFYSQNEEVCIGRVCNDVDDTVVVGKRRFDAIRYC